ncbi:MAG: hypothetical protein QOG80_467 [Pseudonocardiales bacterium]|nr:hypothetical protein [Pseudonocardiales bacterium]
MTSRRTGPARTASDADHRLRDLLGADPPASVAALPADIRAQLADVIADAHERQAASLAAAFEATLRHVPFPARKIVKRVLLG